MTTIGICAIVRNEAPYIEEWIAFHLLQGVSNFLIFNDGSSDSTSEILSAIAKSEPVTVIDWEARFQSFDDSQRYAYKFGACWFVGKVNFVAFIDADEFLFSTNGSLLPVELQNLAEQTSALAIELRLFGSDGHIEHTKGYVTSRFTKSTSPSHPGNLWIKTVAKPQEIYDFDSCHSVVLRSGNYVLSDGSPYNKSSEHPGKSIKRGSGSLQINHYMLKSLEEYRQKQARCRYDELASRYDAEFFEARNSPNWANGYINDFLVSFSDQITDRIAQFQRTTNF
jgi:glycosyltransferase involved in cell wall biosynthesis